ncbi:MAG: oxidoreductase, partial [Pelagibaca sp.]|nr:oxidoreductase [Pelagibaca sp.]
MYTLTERFTRVAALLLLLLGATSVAAG